MQEKFDALLRNRTWQLVPRPRHANVITEKWVFKHKLRPGGTLIATKRAGSFVAADNVLAST